MEFLSKYVETFTEALGRVDVALNEHCPFDGKTEELLRFALSIKARSGPCVRKHFRGAVNAGASKEEIAYTFALTMRESAGADDCWTHSIISDLVTIEPGQSKGCS